MFRLQEVRIEVTCSAIMSACRQRKQKFKHGVPRLQVDSTHWVRRTTSLAKGNDSPRRRRDDRTGVRGRERGKATPLVWRHV